MSIITLTTDFGLRDGNVGVMKGVILAIAPSVQIVDLSHQVSAQNIREAAFILHRAVPYFPGGTIHLVVIDPGVGTNRRPLAARLGSQYFVGPDNGLITLWLKQIEEKGLTTEFFHLDRPNYWLSEVSHVFHGRDIFSPVAAHLASGIFLREMGTEINDPVRLELPQPERTPYGWRGEVVYFDSFGNIATNLSFDRLKEQQVTKVNIKGINITKMVSTFGDRPPGELVVLFSSTGDLIISEVNGNAVQRLGVKVGEPIKVTIK